MTNRSARRYFRGAPHARTIMGDDEEALTRREKRGEVGPKDLLAGLVFQLGAVTENVSRLVLNSPISCGFSLTFPSKANAKSTAVFLNKFHSRGLDRRLHSVSRLIRYSRSKSALEPLNRRKRQTSALG
jgi:hypothetical protein